MSKLRLSSILTDPNYKEKVYYKNQINQSLKIIL